MKRKIICIVLALTIAATAFFGFGGVTTEKSKFIKYVDFNASYSAMCYAMKADIDSQKTDVKISWIDILSYLAAKYGNDFKKYKSKDADAFIKRVKAGEKIEDITKDMKYFSYYKQCFDAALGGFVGKYKEQTTVDGKVVWQEKYGLKVFSPIAKTYPYSDFDDFGAGRSFGFNRKHLGHDLMGATGTPVIAIESGTVEVMGWNRYGGWRIGIRSYDKKRYYYYAHLRQNRPFAANLKEGMTVKAGDVIGYIGRTGYSDSENVNGINQSHLHLGMELIFDESQKESDNEIWIDMYAITILLQKHKSEVQRNPDTKEFTRLYQYDDEIKN
ncbi:MAG: M23 family metallopeptidase [Bacillota bacterium]|nr:M23 family metallopeptidase [Bacillota bacterium]